MKEALPNKLLQSISGIEGYNENQFEEAHQQSRQITSVRLNTDKLKHLNNSPAKEILDFDLDENVPWCELGFYIKERPQFIFDPLIHAGTYYVQEASSMFLWQALQQNFSSSDNIKILDLCAAPGGKTTLLASYFNDALIVANEVIKSRANILYENIVKWGAENIVVTNNDADDFKKLENYFDLIVIDAPCSGSGLFRKDVNAIDEWSESNVALCAQRQQRIIADAYSCLKQNGVLIYATCSYSTEEDEAIADWLLDNFACSSLPLQLNNEWNIVETRTVKHKAFAYRFWPHKVKGEGFFLAVFKKNDGDTFNGKNNFSLTLTSKQENVLLQQYVTAGEQIFFKQQNIIRALHKQWNNDVALLQKNLYLKKAGIQLGEIKGNDLVPHHELALCTIFNNNVLSIELTKEQALQYLRKKEMTLQQNNKGWCLCRYKNFPLGWIKFLHNRVNNYYPTEWRILKE